MASVLFVLLKIGLQDKWTFCTPKKDARKALEKGRKKPANP